MAEERNEGDGTDALATLAALWLDLWEREESRRPLLPPQRTGDDDPA